jgi:hypothetical protein
MDVIAMMDEILSIAKAVIREAALPYLKVSSDERAECMRVSALD